MKTLIIERENIVYMEEDVYRNFFKIPFQVGRHLEAFPLPAISSPKSQVLFMTEELAREFLPPKQNGAFTNIKVETNLSALNVEL